MLLFILIRQFDITELSRDNTYGHFPRWNTLWKIVSIESFSHVFIKVLLSVLSLDLLSVGLLFDSNTLDNNLFYLQCVHSVPYFFRGGLFVQTASTFSCWKSWWEDWNTIADTLKFIVQLFTHFNDSFWIFLFFFLSLKLPLRSFSGFCSLFLYFHTALYV